VVLKRLKIIHKLYLAFGIIIIFMLLVLGYTYMNFLKVSQVVDVNFSAYQIMRESDGILNSIVNIETGSRGYTITGNERDLQSYNDGKTNFIVHYNALKLLSSKNKEQQSILEDFSKKYKIWIEIQSDIIAKKRLEISRDQNFEIAKPPKSKPSQLPNDSRNSADLVGSGRDSGVMNNLQVILKNINNEEKRSLGIESVNLKITKTKTYLSIVLGGLITTILAILISFFTELSITNPIKMLINAFERELLMQKRNAGNIAFVMIDIDHFKKVNDTYGHFSGNMVLKELANILKSSVREGDIVGRYGGEGFSIVLPEIDSYNAFLICDRIRAGIEVFNFNIGSESIKITVSMGVFLKDLKDNITANEIIQKADEELYIVKNNGRNRMEIRTS